MADARTDIIYFQTVEDRPAKSLLSVIYDHSIPKSIIASDSYSSYSKIYRLHDENIEHKMVNHSLNFVYPVTITHTNKIESLWNKGKIKFKDLRGCNRLYNQSYLDEFMWQHNNNFHQFQVFNKGQPIRTTAKLANINNRSIIINNRENIAPETVSNDENEPKSTNRARVLSF